MKKLVVLMLSAVLFLSFCRTVSGNRTATKPHQHRSHLKGMGGVGIADPQDAISAVSQTLQSNVLRPILPGSEMTFDVTFFMPKAKTRINNTAIGAFTGGRSREIPAGWTATRTFLSSRRSGSQQPTPRTSDSACCLRRVGSWPVDYPRILTLILLPLTIRMYIRTPDPEGRTPILHI